MKRSLMTLFMVALLVALIIGCSDLGVPIGQVSNDENPNITASNETPDPSAENHVETPVAAAPEDTDIVMSTSQEEGFSKEVRAKTDLDGDGKEDRIILKTRNNPNGDEVSSYLLLVNDEEILYEGEMIDPLFHVTDINPEDGYREIAVSEEGPSNDNLTVFYRYKDSGLSVLGEIQGFLGVFPGSDYKGEVTIPGDGSVETRTRGQMLQTWFYDDVYRLNENDELEKIPKDLYPFETEVTLIKELKTQKSREDASPSYTFQAGEKATLMETDEKEWVSIRNQAGEISWFKVESYMTILGQDSEGYSMDFFEGLSMAD